MEPNTTNNVTPPKPKNKLLIVAVILLISILAVGVAYAMTASNPAQNSQSNEEVSNDQAVSIGTSSPAPTSNVASWMTKGAYANYQGSAEVLSMSITFDARMEIVDLNSTHAQIETTYNVVTPFGTEANSTSFWVSKADAAFKPEGLDVNSTYQAQVFVAELGNRDCTVYEYSNDDFSVAYYVDNVLNWPVKMVMSSPIVDGQSYSMSLSLTSTNIPGL
jgi:hypothetical protein